MTGADADPKVGQESTLVEQTEFEANIDLYLDAAEAGQSFCLVRDGVVVCHLTPPEA